MTPRLQAAEAIRDAAAVIGWRDGDGVQRIATAALEKRGVADAEKIVRAVWVSQFWVPGLDGEGMGG